MRANPQAISSTATVNGYLCGRCASKSMEMHNFGAVVPNKGECWCAPGYGSYTRKLKVRRPAVTR